MQLTQTSTGAVLDDVHTQYDPLGWEMASYGTNMRALIGRDPNANRHYVNVGVGRC